MVLIILLGGIVTSAANGCVFVEQVLSAELQKPTWTAPEVLLLNLVSSMIDLGPECSYSLKVHYSLRAVSTTVGPLRKGRQ